MIPELAHLSTSQAHALFAQKAIALLPVGAIEAHGPHLPLDTDVIIARATAQAAGKLLQADGLPVVILPALTYSVSLAGTSSSGTIPLRRETFRQVLIDVIEGVARMGARAVGLCNAHLEPVHIATIEEALVYLRQELEFSIAFVDHRQEPFASQLGDEFVAGARHAGAYETSLVMATAPERVQHNALEDLPPLWIDLPAKIQHGARTFAEAGSPLSYFGNPAAATRADGERWIQLLGRIVRDEIQQQLASAG